MLKTSDEIEVMAEGGKRLAHILRLLASEIVPGVSTAHLDQRARKLMQDARVTPAFLGYRPHGATKGFPAAICVSINSEVVHGIPSSRVLVGGDVVKLDIGVIYHGWYTDAAVTVGVGAIDRRARELIEATRDSLSRAILQAIPGNTLGDIGHAVERTAARAGFTPIQGLTGHGVGRNLHEDPSVPNTGQSHAGERLRRGMVLAIEPMVCTGDGKIRELPDHSYVTLDGSLAAHEEHTVAITDKGPRVLTQ